MDGTNDRWAAGRAPSSEFHQVRRHRLLAGLDREAPGILLLLAPVGYGKTTLLHQWLQRDRRASRWLHLEPADNEPGRLASRLAAALAGLTAPYVLVLDDVHHLGPGALQQLKELAADLPDGCTLASAGQTRPALSLGVLRARRRVLDLDLHDLAFDAREAAELLAARGLDVSPAQVDALVARTEGWPAAIQMAAATAASAPDPARALRDFAGDHRTMVELLGSDVLDRLVAADAVQFLLAAAPLPRLSGALCDAVLHRTGSAGLLEQLAAHTLLVLPLDQNRRWYRLHSALQAYLSSEQRLLPLAGTDGEPCPPPEEVLGLASRWFEAEGDIDSAIAHAAAANDPDRATELVMRHFSTRVGTGNPTAVLAWLQQIDNTSVTTSPMLQCVAALVRMGLGDADGAMRCLQRAEFGLHERYPQQAPANQPAACVAGLRALLGRVTAEEMRADARFARRHTASPMWFAVACLADGGSSFMLGDLDAAEEAWRAATAVAEPINHTSWVIAHACLALVHERRGDRALAQATARQARRLLAELELEAVPQLYQVHLLSAWRHMLLGREADALREQEAGVVLLDRCRGLAPWGSMQAHVTLAGIAHLRGDAQGKSRWLDAAEATLVGVPDAIMVKDQIADLRALVTISRDGADGTPALSAAERRVLQYLPTHLPLAEIAERLYLSRHTVKSHVVAVYRKLGVANRSEAVEVAYRRSLIEPTALDLRPEAR